MKTAVVTGAGSGIGSATARRLAAEGFRVICAGRRIDRLTEVADEIGGQPVACDVTKEGDVAELADLVGEKLDLLVNNAGGALGLEPVAQADLVAWDEMYQVNVLGAARVTKALLPAIRAAEGTVVFVTSIAAEAGYQGGAGYCGVKAAERAMAESMRSESLGEPIRICEIVPGLVKTAEFSLRRFDGDQAKADAVYAGVPGPLVASDVADCIGFVATRPPHVNIDRLTVRPRAQAGTQVFREAT